MGLNDRLDRLERRFGGGDDDLAIDWVAEDGSVERVPITKRRPAEFRDLPPGRLVDYRRVLHRRPT